MNQDYNYQVSKTLEEKLINNYFSSGDITMTSKYSHNDAIIEYPDKIVIAEVKSRNLSSTDYESEGWILEQYKLSELIHLHNETKAKYPGKKIEVVYLNYFKRNNELIVWDLKDLIKNKKHQIKKAKKLMNKHSSTGFSRYGDKVMKIIYFLTKSLSMDVKPNFI